MTIVSRLELPKFRISSFKIERYDVVRMILGLVLLAAAALKGYQLATEPTLEKGLLTSRWFLILEVEFEIAFGLLLLSGLYRHLTWLAAIGCFSIFSLVTFYKGISGEASCGCFGKVEINPWYTLIFDLFAVVTLLFFRHQTPHQPFRISWRPTIIFGVLVLLIGLPSAHAMISFTPTTLNDDGFIEGESNFVILELEKWVGKKFPLLKYIDIGNELSKGNWIIVMYSDSCSNCRKNMAAYQELTHNFKGEDEFVRASLIEVPPFEKRSNNVEKISYFGQLSDSINWVISVPIVAVLKDGKTLAVWKDVPSLDSVMNQTISPDIN
jgi:hypothetical protein